MPSAKPTVGVDDLATLFPKIAAEAYGWDPTTVKAGSDKIKLWWCPKGHSYPQRVKDRTKGRECGVCAGKILLVGFNDLKTKFRDIAKEAEGWDPSTVLAGSNEMKWWKCKLGHPFQHKINNRTSKSKSGCRYCSNQKAWAGFNDLKTTHPKIADEAYGWCPRTVTFGQNEPKKWKCKLGHIYEASMNSRTGVNKTGCKYCSNQAVWVGFNDLKTTHPTIAEEAYGWDPTTVTAGHNKKKWWRCKLGHPYPASVNQKTSKDTGCPYCCNHKAWAGFNDLKTTHPVIAEEAYGWCPRTVTYGSEQLKKWKCKKCDHKWSAVVSSRTPPANNGCPKCAEYGYDPSKPAWFYLMQRVGEQQLGITNDLHTRIKKHESEGWILLDKRGPKCGRKVLDTENAFKKWLKEKIGLIEGKTENWATTSMEVKDLAELKARSGIETDLF